MGNELKGAVRAGKERHEGKILLETSELIFRGTDYRLKIAFGEMRDVKAENGELVVETKDGVNVFEVGAHAEKWRDKILHPKSRAEKLGVKAGTRVRLLGEIEADFVKELRAAKAQLIQTANSADVANTFFALGCKSALAAFGKYAKKMKGAEAKERKN